MLKEIYISELIPNNFYINEFKLNNIRKVYSIENQSDLPPVLVAVIGNEYSLIDGHSRVMGAFERGLKTIIADIYPIEELEGPIDLYKAIHVKAKENGLNSIASLKNRIVTPEEHTKLWVRFCENLMKEIHTWRIENEL